MTSLKYATSLASLVRSLPSLRLSKALQTFICCCVSLRAIFSVVEALGQGPVGGPCVYIYTYDTACRCPYLYMWHVSEAIKANHTCLTLKLKYFYMGCRKSVSMESRYTPFFIRILFTRIMRLQIWRIKNNLRITNAQILYFISCISV